MNAGVRVLRTAAEEAYFRTLSTAVPTLPGADWARAMRRKAAEHFEAHGLPHRRLEEWRWTDLRSVVRDVPPLAERLGDSAAGPAALPGFDAHRLVFVNGAFAKDLSDPLPDTGFEVTRLADLLEGPHRGMAEKVGSLAQMGDGAPLWLNAALMQDGAVVRVREGAVLERPIRLAFVFSGPPAAVYTRNLVVIEPQARATVVETYEGPAATPYHVNAATELFVGEGAEMRHMRVQDDGMAAIHLGSLLAEVGASSRLETFSFVSGAAVSRQRIGILFAGEHASAAIDGVSLLGGRQHGDTALLVDHAVPHGSSRERFKAALDEEARGVFQGKIIVRRGAQKTDAKMSANGLFLAEGAEFNGKPELEIFADDVQCGHGATAGELDENHIFYLRARGIPQAEAEGMLVRAYVADALEAVGDGSLREALETRADTWLGARRPRIAA